MAYIRSSFIIQPGPGLSDGGGVGEHADGSVDLGQVTSGDNGGRLVVDALKPVGQLEEDSAEILTARQLIRD